MNDQPAARRLGLRGRLILLVLAAFTLIFAVVVRHVLEHRGELIDNAEIRLLYNARLIAARQQYLAAHANAILLEMSTHPAMRRGVAAPECQTALAARLAHESEFIQLGKVGPDGEVACAAVPPGEDGVNFADRAWFRQTLQAKQIVVSNLVVGRILHRPVITLSRAIRDNDGRVAGVLYLALDLSHLHDELLRAGLPEGARVAVVDDEGTIAVRYPDPEGWAGREKIPYAGVAAAITAGEEGVFQERDLKGEKRFFAFTPLLKTAVGRLTLLVSMPEAVATGPALRELNAALLIITAVLALVLGLVYWGGELLLLRPLLALSRAAARFGAGEHDVRSGLAHTDDEIGQLARTLDETSAIIQAKEESLARANRGLRVLSAGNRALLHANSGDEPDLLTSMCRAMVEAGGYRLAWVGYAENDREQSVRQVAAWGEGEGFPGERHMTWGDTESGRGPVGAAIRKGIPIVANDILADPDCAPWREAAQAHGIAALLALPLRVKGVVIGALCVCAAESVGFDEEVVDLLGEAADDLSFGITSRRAAAELVQTKERLTESEGFAARVLNAVGEGICGLDRRGRITFINPAGAALLQRTPEELLDADMHVLSHHTRADGTPYPAEECLIRAAYRDGLIYQGEDELFWRKDGTAFPVEYFSAPIRGADHELSGAVVSFNDISERKENEMALRRLNRALRTLSAGNQVLIHAEEEEALLSEFCRVAVEIGGYRLAWVGYLDDTPEKKITPRAWIGAGDDFPERMKPVWEELAGGQGPIGRVLRDGATTAVTMHELTADSSQARWGELAAAHGFAAVFAHPLRFSGRISGVFAICAAESEAFDAEEMRLLTELGNDLAFGIETLRTRAERDRVRYEHEHHAEILQKSLEQSIQAIAATVEARDPYTAGHQRRVAALATAIARELGLAAERIHGLSLAGVVHDLGKIQVPSEILAKPSKLTDIEFMLIKTHPQAGYEIIKDIEFPWPIADIVHQHHERLDGSGYPQGLKGSAILLESRIMSVADVVEAMASHRPYRAALGVETALKEIERGRGGPYDPAVADACLRLFRERGFTWEG